MTVTDHGRVQHRLVLSNGQVLLVEEGDESVHLATEDVIEGQVEYYVAAIDNSGVTVMCNAGDANVSLVSGLKLRAPEPAPPPGTVLATVGASQRRYYAAQVEVRVPAGSADEKILEAARTALQTLPEAAWTCTDADKVELEVEEVEDAGGPDEGGA